MAEREKYYYSAYHPDGIARSRLHQLPLSQQLRIMSTWFTANYIDIHYYPERAKTFRGPRCDVAAELLEEFAGAVPDTMSLALAESLTGDGEEWVKIGDLRAGKTDETTDTEGIGRPELLRRLASLERAIQELRTVSLLGHNHPPEAIDQFPLVPASIAELNSAIDRVRAEVVLDQGSKKIIEDVVQTLSKVATDVSTWLAGKADTATDELAKTAGKAAGIAIIAHVTAIDHQLWELISTLGRWIASLH